jgi:hypothetical protein
MDPMDPLDAGMMTMEVELSHPPRGPRRLAGGYPIRSRCCGRW